jgi:hypothetical protein
MCADLDAKASDVACVPCIWNRICHWPPYLRLAKADEVTAVTARFLWENVPKTLLKLVILTNLSVAKMILW